MTPNNKSVMTFSNLGERLAEVAHACWCEKMIQEGWRPGEETDDAAMTHAGLRPYAELSPRLRAHLRLNVNDRDVKRSLYFGLEHLFDSLPLTFDVVSVGARVRHHHDAVEDVGTVESIQAADEEPEVIATIRVRWADGNVEECFGWELLLVQDD